MKTLHCIQCDCSLLALCSRVPLPLLEIQSLQCSLFGVSVLAPNENSANAWIDLEERMKPTTSSKKKNNQKTTTITSCWARTRAFNHHHMFLSGWELLFQVLLLVNIASHRAAMAHLSICSLDSQYWLLNTISCGIFLLSSPGRLWHVQPLMSSFLASPHVSHRRGRRKTRTDRFDKCLSA